MRPETLLLQKECAPRGDGTGVAIVRTSAGIVKVSSNSPEATTGTDCGQQQRQHHHHHQRQLGAPVHGCGGCPRLRPLTASKQSFARRSVIAGLGMTHPECFTVTTVPPPTTAYRLAAASACRRPLYVENSRPVGK